jgi:octaprenyl-diphosphate synthase
MSSLSLPKTEETGRRLAAVYAPIAPELAEAERIFEAELGSRFPFVQRLVDHSADFRGKRLRPALVLLTARPAAGSARRTRSWRPSSR